MLDDIRNLVGDMLSGKMKDAEISLTKQESVNLRLKLDGLLDEATNLRNERVILISKLEAQRIELGDKDSLIANLKAQLDKRDPVADRLEDPTCEVLRFLFDSGEAMALESIMQKFLMASSVAKFHLGVLLKLKFISFEESTVGFGMDDGFYDGCPDQYAIVQKGREYVMKNC